MKIPRLSVPPLYLPVVGLTAWLAALGSAQAGTYSKNSTSNPLNTAASWTNNAVPTSADIAQWDSNVTANPTCTLGGNLAVLGIKVVNPYADIDLSGADGFFLTNGTSGIDLTTATKNLTIECPLVLSGIEVFNPVTGKTLTVGPVISGYKLSKSGSGALVFTGATNYVGGQFGPNGGSTTFNLGAAGVFNGFGKFPITSTCTINWQSGIGNFTPADFIAMADGGTAVVTVNLTGGTINFNPTAQRVMFGDQGTNIFNVNGGTLNVATAAGSAGLPVYVGGDSQYTGNNASGTINIGNGGQMVIGGTAVFGLSQTNGANPVATGTLNLNSGGSLQTSRQIVKGSPNNSGSANVNFNGGTLKASTGMTLLQTYVNTLVKVGGAKIDDLGNVVTIGQALNHDSALGAAADGGLTKLGIGTLKVDQNCTYTGPTTISAGTLALTTGSLSNTALITLNSGTTFDVSAVPSFVLGANQTLSGLGTVNGPVTASVGATILPGGLNNVGTLTMASDLTLNGNTIPCDLTSGGGADQLAVTGTLVLNGNNYISLNYLNGTIPAGTYTLLTFAGISGTGSISLDAVYRDVTLTVDATSVSITVGTEGSTGANLTWQGDGTANVWDNAVTANWLNNGTADLFYSQDNVTFDDAGSNTPPVALTGVLNPGALVVNNSAVDYAFAGTGSIGGRTGLTKTGTGLLTIGTTNTFTGPVAINGGTVSISIDANLGTAPGGATPGNLNVNNGALSASATMNLNANRGMTIGPASGSGTGTLDVAAGKTLSYGGAITNNGTGTGTLTKTGTGTLVLSASNSGYTGPTVVNGGVLSVGYLALNGSPSGLGAGTSVVLDGGTLQYTGANLPINNFSRTFTLNAGGGTIDSSGSGGYMFVTNLISGPGSLTKSGSKQLIIGATSGSSSSAGNNSYDGDTFVNVGELQIRNANALGSTVGKTVVASGADLAAGGGADLGTTYENIDLNGDTANGALEVNDNLTKINFGGTINLLSSCGLGTVNNGAAVTFVISGPIVGPGALKKYGTNSITLTCPTNSYAGGTLLTNATLQLGNGGTAGTLGTGPVTNNAALVWNHTDNTTNSAVISGTGSVTHNGSGMLVLEGANIYSGATLINGGTVMVNGSLAGGPVIVGNGGTLSGYGTIGGPVTNNAGSALLLGPALGTLTVNNTLVLNGTTTMKLAKSGATLSSDLIQGVTTLVYGGTLNVTASGDPLAAGDTFQLFSASAYQPGFASFNLPVLPPALVWDTSRLVVNGTIQVLAAPTVAVTPASSTVECGNNNVTLTANATGLPAPTLQWYDNTGSAIAGATSTTLTLDNVKTSGSWSVVASNVAGTATNSAHITVQDTSSPAITCPSDISVVATEASGATVSFTVTATDSCDPNPTVISTPVSGSVFAAGTNTVTSVATDSSGNTNSCSFQIIVDRAPVVQTNLSVYAIQDQSLTLELTNLTALATDPDNDPLTVSAADLASTNGGTVTLTDTNLLYQPVAGYVGDDLFNYIIADGRGGLATNSVLVTVVSSNALTVAVSPSSTNIECGGGVTLTAVTADVPAPSFQWYDNGTNLLVDQTNAVLTLTNLHPGQAGYWTVVMTNSVTQATGVASLTVVDSTPPTITLFGDDPLTVECHSAFTDPGATAEDICAGPVAVSPSGSVDPNTPGTYTITYSATDGQNTATATRTVHVVDTTPPLISWSFTNLTLSADANCSALMPDVTGTNYVLAADACSAELVITQTPTNNATLVLGTNEVVLAVSDSTGNTAYSTNWIIVVDTTGPAITILGSNPLTNECHSAFVDPGATAQDNCSGVVAVLTNGVVDANAPGQYTVEYVATDAAGNWSTNSRTVYVVDTTAPTITQCAPPQTVTAGYNGLATLADLTTLIVASDACSPSVNIAQQPAAGTAIPVGTTTVVFSVDDGNGNTNTCSTTVTVNAIVLVPPTLLSQQVLLDGSFQLTFSGPEGQPYKVIASEDPTLAPTNWQVLDNGSFGSTPVTFTDSSLPRPAARFYRITSP